MANAMACASPAATAMSGRSSEPFDGQAKGSLKTPLPAIHRYTEPLREELLGVRSSAPHNFRTLDCLRTVGQPFDLQRISVREQAVRSQSNG